MIFDRVVDAIAVGIPQGPAKTPDRGDSGIVRVVGVAKSAVGQ
jgi:hypothetical protein